MTSTPRPEVALSTPSRNDVSRELKMFEGLMPNVLIRYSLFSSVETVVKTYTEH